MDQIKLVAGDRLAVACVKIEESKFWGGTYTLPYYPGMNFASAAGESHKHSVEYRLVDLRRWWCIGYTPREELSNYSGSYSRDLQVSETIQGDKLHLRVSGPYGYGNPSFDVPLKDLD